MIFDSKCKPGDLFYKVGADDFLHKKILMLSITWYSKGVVTHTQKDAQPLWFCYLARQHCK